MGNSALAPILQVIETIIDDKKSLTSKRLSIAPEADAPSPNQTGPGIKQNEARRNTAFKSSQSLPLEYRPMEQPTDV
ncbi:hypothetical protein RI367_005362 [Sorochytrium milnesiophthora]